MPPPPTSTSTPTLALCTFSTGDTLVREVLQDWLDFLPSRPDRVIVSTLLRDRHDASRDVHPVYRELVDEGLIDQLIELDAPGLDGRTAETLGTLSALHAADTDLALQIKLDTLPFRAGHADWLDEARAILHDGEFFAFTGSMSDYDATPLPRVADRELPPGRYYQTQRFSVNFALVQPRAFVQRAVDTLGQWCLDPPQFVARGGDETSRFAVETVVNDAIARDGLACFSRNETPDWTIFHVNVWGKTLAGVHRPLPPSRQDHPLPQPRRHPPGQASRPLELAVRHPRPSPPPPPPHQTRPPPSKTPLLIPPPHPPPLIPLTPPALVA